MFESPNIVGLCLITKHCWIVFDHQTYPVWTGLNDYALNSSLSGQGLSPGQGYGVVFEQTILPSQRLSPPRCTKDIWVSVNYMQQKGEGRMGLTWDRLSSRQGGGGGGKHTTYNHFFGMTGCIKKKILSDSWSHVKFSFNVGRGKRQFARRILQSIRGHSGSFFMHPFL